MTSKFSSDPEVSSMLKDLSQRIAGPGKQAASKPARPNGGVSKAALNEKAPLNEKASLNEKAPAKAASPAAEDAAVVAADAVKEPEPYVYKREIVWFNTLGFAFMHMMSLYGVYLGLFRAQFLTMLWASAVGWTSAMSVLMGAHRLYTHRSYKATFPLRLLIVLWQTVSSQNCMWVWVRDHRQHHKYSDTNADPHNASRGFFFSHIGWLMVRKHRDVFEAGRKVDMSDIEADWLVMFQKKYYNILYVLLSVLFPTVVPVYLWNESWWYAFVVCFIARTFVILNVAWLVNSWAHLYGSHPFNNDILPSDSNVVAFLTFGEGWHNFHHTFPWDYRAAEFGQHFNFTCTIIEFFEKIGWAYDLKCAPEELVRKRALRTGDGSHPRYNKHGVPAHLVAEPEPGVEDLDVDDETGDGVAVLAKEAAKKTEVLADRSKQKRG